ncbi:MAG: putative toxin-antitoxin system toxin component, PIN family [Solirubrobacteraceae bacterium]
MRAVLDVNVVVSGLLSHHGAPAAVLRALDNGEFDALASPKLLAELTRALAYPKLRRHIPANDAEAILQWFAGAVAIVPDPDATPPVRSEDAEDDYLIALAATHRAALVSGDKHLLALEAKIPVFTPRAFLSSLHAR